MLKLKEDWSLAYLMYYLFQISFWLNLVLIIMQVFLSPVIFRNSGESMTLRPIPVRMEIEQLSGFNDWETESLTLNVNETVTGSVFIRADIKENLFSFVYYTGIQTLDFLILLLVLHFVSRLLKNVAEGNPFHKANPKYLFIIGWLMFLTSLAYMTLAFSPTPLFDSIAINGLEIKSISFRDNGFMTGGILAIIFGYVFKEGARIYEEQKLTV